MRAPPLATRAVYDLGFADGLRNIALELVSSKACEATSRVVVAKETRAAALRYRLAVAFGLLLRLKRVSLPDSVFQATAVVPKTMAT